MAIYVCNYCGNDWQIWITLVTWTWCLRKTAWGLKIFSLSIWKWTWPWTWTWRSSILVTKCGNEHTIWMIIITWMWSGIAFKRLREHELEPTWNILAINVEMSSDEIKMNHIHERKLFLQLLWKQVRILISDPGIPGVRFLGLGVTNSKTFCRINWCDSGWRRYQLNTCW